MTKPRYRQFCALARAAEVVGERWTLLIVRELLLGPKRFTDLSERLSGLSPTLLTDRLESLAANKIIRRTQPGEAGIGQTYQLTDIGRALHPAIRELIKWGGIFLFPMRRDDVFEPDWVLLALDAIARATPTAKSKIGLVIRQGRKSAHFIVEGGREGASIRRGTSVADATIETQFDVLLRIIGRDINLEDAERNRLARITGSRAAALLLPTLFDPGRNGSRA